MKSEKRKEKREPGSEKDEKDCYMTNWTRFFVSKYADRQQEIDETKFKRQLMIRSTMLLILANRSVLLVCLHLQCYCQ